MGAPDRHHLLAFAVAGIWLASNIAKPLTVDDAAYYMFARQIAGSPADPYGFTIFWYQSPQPAIEVLAPPVWLYWWAAGIRWLGNHEWAWKLWQFPFVYLFVASYAHLARRFAPGPLTGLLPVFLVLSPVFLPGLNLMLDVPAIALGLAAVVLFVRASDRGSIGGAVLAGLIAGIAMQTKYTGLLVPLVMIGYAALLGRLRLAMVAGGVAAAVFVSWEAAMIWGYGQSQFLAALVEPGGGASRRWSTLPALVTLAGGAGSAWGLLALAALGVRRRLVWGAMLAGAGAFVAVGWLPERTLVSLPEVLAAALGRPGVHLNPALDLSRLLGVLVVGALGFVVARVRRDGDRAGAFLLIWFAVELTGYVLLNPFVAVRRIMGLAVISTLLVGRLASRTCQGLERQHLIRAVTGYGIILAALFAVSDVADALAQRDGATRAANAARAMRVRPDARLWYVGHWGFQFYAERAGMAPVVPGISLLRQGDMLVVPGPPVDVQRTRFPPSRVAPVAQVASADNVAWRALPGYYRGAVPLSGRGWGPRLGVTIYRVREDFVPEPEHAR